MNIFGEGFPEEIVKQIATRQTVYGSGFLNNQRSPEELAFLNGNTSWCKLVSGVNIKDSKLINSPTIANIIESNNLSQTSLARDFVLFNGVAEPDLGVEGFTGRGLRSGIDLTNSLTGDGKAYGIGGTEFGLRPMMGIISANVTHENRGSLRRAEVKIKAFNRTQFEIIDVLYLRLGFNVLLEWGNTMYFDNEGNLQNTISTLSDEFLDGKLDGKVASYENFLTAIREQRLKTYGNYDAMFAKVANFQWSFLPDGSYDITLKLSSVGDIIESLKVNTLISVPLKVSTEESTEEKQQEAKEDGNSGDIVDAWYSVNTICNFLYMLKCFVDNNDFVQRRTEVRTFQTDIDHRSFSINWLNETELSKRQKFVQNNKKLIKFNLSAFEKNKFDVIRLNFEEENLGGDSFLGFKWGNADRYYVRLGTFLQFLQNYVVPKLIPINGTSSPSLRFDFDEDTNIMNANPLQISVDPRICMVNAELELSKKEKPFIEKSVYDGIAVVLNNIFFNPIAATTVQTVGAIDSNRETTTFKYKFGYPGYSQNPFISKKVKIKDDLYGNIMNIYIDFTFIITKIEELKDDQGNLPLIDFLQAIMSGINEGLGGINDFDVFIDETTNIVKIIDKNPLKNLDEIISLFGDEVKFPNAKYYNGGKKLSTTPAFFDLYGYNSRQIEGTDPPEFGGNASFIRDFNFTTEITPDFSTLITVGASANGTVVGENDTALSKLNKGLVDRYKETVTLSINDTGSQPQEIEKQYKTAQEEYSTLLGDYNKYLTTLSSGWNEEGNETKQILAELQDIDSHKGVLSTLVQKGIEIQKLKDAYLESQKQKTSNQVTPGTGFIPFNLALTMDGLSGMKINQQFSIDTSYLPSNYPKSVKFLIKNLSHEISNNRWLTKMESYCIAKDALETTETAPVADEQPKPEVKPEVKPSPQTAPPPPAKEPAPTPAPQNAPKPVESCPDKTNRSGKWKNLPVKTYTKTQVNEKDVIEYLKKVQDISVRRAAYAVFVIESAHGTKGINNNYIGLQTDGGGFLPNDANFVSGTTTIKDNKQKSGKGGGCRAFATYDTWQRCIDHLVAVMTSRKQSSSSGRKMVPSDPGDSTYFGTGYQKNWVGSTSPDSAILGKKLYLQAIAKKL